MGDITIFGQNSQNLNFEHCVNLIANLRKYLNSDSKTKD